MTVQRMEHVGIVVDDLAASTEFFVTSHSPSRTSTTAVAGLRARGGELVGEVERYEDRDRLR